MAAIEVNRLSEASVYLEGLPIHGRAEEVDIPDLKWKQSSSKALGLVGEATFPTSLEPLKAKFKWTSFYPELMAALADPTRAARLQVYGNLRTFANGGELVAERSVVVWLRGWFPSLKLGAFKAHENVATESEMEVLYLRIETDGVPIIEVDTMANIYSVHGVDLLETMRANLGG